MLLPPAVVLIHAFRTELQRQGKTSSRSGVPVIGRGEWICQQEVCICPLSEESTPTSMIFPRIEGSPSLLAASNR
jgi:hypothetical protein